MSDYKKFKKADLAEVAKKAGLPVRAKDTKQDLLKKIEVFIAENPDEVKILVESAGEDAATLVSEDEEEDDDEEEEDEDAEVVDGEKNPNDPPPLDLAKFVVEPALLVYDKAAEFVGGIYDKIVDATEETNDDIRESLSKTVSLNYLELFTELSYFLYYYVPLVEIKHNKSVHQLFKDNVPYLAQSNVVLPDVTALFEIKVVSILANWIVYALAIPAFIAYYVNFTRRVVVISDDDDEEEETSFVIRLYKFDPFVFAVAKVVIFYFIFKNGALTTIDTYKGIVHALKNHLFIQLGIYHQFVTGLGNFPLIIGVANVVISLYSQFEDY